MTDDKRKALAKGLCEDACAPRCADPPTPLSITINNHGTVNVFCDKPQHQLTAAHAPE